jgi:hypothetical protein
MPAVAVPTVHDEEHGRHDREEGERIRREKRERRENREGGWPVGKKKKTDTWVPLI